MSRTLVLYDFDGTITKEDTLWSFIQYYWGTQKFIFSLILLTPILALYALKIIPNWKAKEFVLTHFFKDETLTSFNEKARRFSKQIVPRLVKAKALESLQLHQKANAKVIIVSASAINWVNPWCEEMNVDCIATELEVSHNRLTGKIMGKNCYGREKVNRIKSVIDLSAYAEIIVYGDSNGDKEMMKLGTKTYYKPFR